MSYLSYYLYRKLKPDRFRRFDQLVTNNSKSRACLLDEQKQTLNKLIELAQSTSDYYAHRFVDIIKDGKGNYDITSLPILRKSDVISNRQRMITASSNLNQLLQGKTGGSTGKPVSFYYDVSSIEIMLAGAYRCYTWAGWRPGEKVLHFWGAKQDVKLGNRLRNILSTWITSENTIGVYDYTEEQLKLWVDGILDYRPAIVQGYASILAQLAKYILDTSTAISINIKAVFSTAEVLYPWQRHLIEKAFSCKVFNQYGSREIPNIACECSHGNLHTFTDMAYVESIIEDNENKLIVTSLSNFAMPFIRYEIGDLGKLREGECECGSPFPLMEMGLCRSNDMVVTKSGKNIYPSYFIHLLDGINGIEQFQFVQENYNRIVLNISISGMFEDQVFNDVKSRVKNDIDPDMELSINVVNDIDRTISGKYRYVINNIHPSK